METTTEPLTYPFPDQHAIDLHPLYSRVRDSEAGASRVQLPYGAAAWLVTRYEDVKLVLSDPRFSRAKSISADEPRTMPMIQRANVIVAADPPDHGRLRGTVMAAFTKRRIESMSEGLELVADELADNVERAGSPVDLVDLFAAPLPALAICELLRIPAAERPAFVTLSKRLLCKALLSQPPEQTRAAGRELWIYLAGLAERRRAAPLPNDLLSSLVAAEDAGTITGEELVAICVTFLVGGHDAMTMQIGNLVYRLLTDVDKAEQLRRSPELLPAAIEELTRISPIGIGTVNPRIATADVELSGITVRAGEFVVAAIGPANRDPAVFPDPETVDFERPGTHLGFGHGLHRCLGAELARLELKIALSTLLRRFPALRLAIAPADVPWSTGPLPRSAIELPVAW